MKKLWIGMGIVVVALAIVLVVSQTKREPEEIKIGAILPLTGDGAKYGEEAKNGIDLAVEEINNKGGVSGQKIKIIYEDDQGTSSRAVAAFNKLITVDKVPVIIGAMYSSTTLALAPIAEKSKVVLFSPSASSPEVTKAGDYIFRNWPSDIYEGYEMAKFAFSKLRLRKIAILSVNVDYGLGLTVVFKREFSKLGGQVIAMEKYDQGVTDFRTQLSKIRVQKPEALYLPGYYTEIALILKQALESGFDAQFLSCVGFDNPKSLELAGKATEGVIFARPAYDPASKEKSVTSFVETFKSKYGIVPGTYAAHAYDAMKIILYAIGKGGYDADSIKQILYTIKDFPGVTGKTTFDENGDVIKPIQIMAVKSGVFVPHD